MARPFKFMEITIVPIVVFLVALLHTHLYHFLPHNHLPPPLHPVVILLVRNSHPIEVNILSHLTPFPCIIVGFVFEIIK